MTGTCAICGRWGALESHHVFGGSNRKKSERYGYKVSLCHWCHNEPPNGVHHNAKNMLALHQKYQRIFEQTHTRQQFMSEFGKDYLD